MSIVSASDRGELSPASRIWTIAICFLIILLDGLDTTAIGFVAPALSGEWGLDRSAITPAFVATNAGALIGYLICGPIAQRCGYRLVGTASVFLFAGGTLLSALAYDIPSLTILRFVSAIGLGGALPIAITAATQVAQPKKRPAVAMLVATGISVGAVIGGVTAVPLIQAMGWRSVFVIGGIAPLLLLPFFAKVLPSKPIGSHSETSTNSPIKELFADGLAPATLLLWLYVFLIGLVTYSLQLWTPTLLIDFGFSAAQAPLGAAAVGMGGLIGNLLTLAIMSKIGPRTVLIFASVPGILCLIALGQLDVAQGLVLPLIAGVGAGVIVGYAGSTALGVALYPGEARSTGVGWASAMGRFGSIVGPALGGVQLALGWPAKDIIMTLVIPAGVSFLALVAMGLVRKRPESNEATT